MGTGFRYYRPLYSLFAFVTLILLLWYQYSIPGIALLRISWISILLGSLITFPGLAIMIICIHKYFYELSGLKALQEDKKEVTLQTRGLHAIVRHPLYFGTLLFTWGLLFIFPLLYNLIACVVITVYTIIGIRLEEKKLVEEFGEAYTDYAKKVPRLIPGIL
jgi:protein-S-isoprenylcysteine O-methyltransferase Ste14